ncbi:hypothetical protein Sez_1071 [Streptococcus equi subsp. zooepidemicus MGCS10565]|uniref:Uncharacterized protein n=1 Tax=Streptococcus equi subsp. zooepidemicus (strain MGCS10565) TaxID=552526 RepID=B4U356_STREM|nr:hypothetical protein Sez_1071 [Streptococcus equi subsp. zooepidemicus MGCS10565]AEJ25371.1 conserved hypothetical protein [Streptococcus equi subsp. zooepidemicus ATCC 35246]AIA68688.1 hypothetical protein Q426_03745 [Streptococcus equi subsp. zooepidemicus CY]
MTSVLFFYYIMKAFRTKSKTIFDKSLFFTDSLASKKAPAAYGIVI